MKELICERIGLEKKEQILSYDLYLCDCQPGNLLGIHNEFVVGQGLDDLSCSYGNLYGFLDACQSDISELPTILLSVFYEGEEVGSVSRRGAHSVFLPTIMERIASCFSIDKSEFIQMKDIGESKSFLLSLDVGHANHPNLSNHIEKNQKIYMNRGLYTEQNSKMDLILDQRDLVTIQEIAKKADVPIQIGVKKQEGGGGGSTIGPHIASFTGLVVVDLGVPMLSMHSAREVSGSKDTEYLRTFVKNTFLHYHEYL